jgi:hypothetical protein
MAMNKELGTVKGGKEREGDEDSLSMSKDRRKELSSPIAHDKLNGLFLLLSSVHCMLSKNQVVLNADGVYSYLISDARVRYTCTQHIVEKQYISNTKIILSIMITRNVPIRQTIYLTKVIQTFIPSPIIFTSFTYL